MSESRRKMSLLLGALAVGIVLWGLVRFGWYAPRAAALNERLDDATERVRSKQSALENRPRLQRQLNEIVDRTLGDDVETVDHRLRTRLNRIAEQLQLHQPTVSTGRPSTRQNPARLAFPRAAREMRDEIDFIELDGSISAEGTLEQIIALVDRIEAEPWIKRIHTLRLDPKDNGQRFGVTLRLSTLFLPGRAPQDRPRPEYDPHRLDRFASLVQANPFHLPPPAVSQPAAEPAPVTARRIEQWLVTGIAHGPEGAEAWLRNARSGESRRVMVGGRIEDVVLVAATRDEVEFEQNERRLVVAIGGTLSIQR